MQISRTLRRLAALVAIAALPAVAAAAQAGQTYVVELWDVARSVESVHGTRCGGSDEDGVVADPDRTTITGQCEPRVSKPMKVG